MQRIFICDDSGMQRALISQLLSAEYERFSFASAEDLLEALSYDVPDLIISDVVMPGMSGYELCQKVRSDPRLRFVPVVLLTATSDLDARAVGLESGADDYLLKPLRPRELHARVRSLLRLRTVNLELERRSVELEAANANLRKTQSALVQAEKLATVGTLAAGVAHEVNNPLAYMKAGARMVFDCAELLEHARRGREMDPHERRALEDLREISREIEDGVLRLERISNDLKAYAGNARYDLEQVDVRAGAHEAWTRVTALVPAAPRLVTELKDLPPLPIAAHLFGEVLFHLLLNAAQAAQSVRRTGDGEVHVTGQKHGRSLRLRIQDSGPGIAPEHLGRIFDPFFTTRPPGQGTGMGLSVAYGIVQSFGGHLEVESPPGEGATFTVTLPLAQPQWEHYNALRSGAFALEESRQASRDARP